MTLRGLFLITLATALLSAPADATSIVQNGTFATGDLTDWTEHTCGSECTYQGWSVSSVNADPGTTPSDTTFAAQTACVSAPCNDPSGGD